MLRLRSLEYLIPGWRSQETPPEPEPLEAPWRVKLVVSLKDKTRVSQWTDSTERPEDKWERFQDFKQWYFESDSNEFLLESDDTDVLIRRADITGIEVRLINLENTK